MTLHGNGHQTRSFCYVADLVDGLYRVMQSKNTIGQVYNIGNPTEYTITELAQAVCQVAEIPENIVAIESPRQDDPARRCPNIDKIKAAIGWEPTTTLAVGLKSTFEFVMSTTHSSGSETAPSTSKTQSGEH